MYLVNKQHFPTTDSGLNWGRKFPLQFQSWFILLGLLACWEITLKLQLSCWLQQISLNFFGLMLCYLCFVMLLPLYLDKPSRASYGRNIPQTTMLMFGAIMFSVKPQKEKTKLLCPQTLYYTLLQSILHTIWQIPVQKWCEFF